MRNLILPFILLLTFVFSCRENEGDEGLEQKNASYDLYVAGRENNEACYWKNNVKIVLPGGINHIARSVVVDNNDVYVFGESRDPTTHVFNYFYWKNNVKYDIAQYLGVAPNVMLNTSPNTSVDINIRINSFSVQNGNIIITGSIKNPSPISSQQNFYQICYWKNAVKTIVFESNEQYEPTIYFIGNDVYAPVITNIVNTPTTNWDTGYYKNGIYQFVNTFSNCLGIYDDGGSLKMLIKDYNSQAIYYKDLLSGAITPPPPFMTFTNSDYSLQIDGNDKYFVGYGSYYKNNVQHNLYSPGSSFRFLNDFKALDNNIYKILHTDDNTGVNYNVYVNDVIVQSATNSSNNISKQFLSLTVVPQ